MKTSTMLVAVLALVSLAWTVQVDAQTQTPPAAREILVEGQVKDIDASGTELTLTDGTRLLAPPGSAIRQGVLTAGMSVIASYREQNGEKVLTGLAVKQEPSAAPPAASPPATAPPSGAPSGGRPKTD
jgi:hypothetical protein